MAASAHAVPVSELNFDGNMAENWNFFRQKFEIYLQASGLVNESETKKAYLLLNRIGDRALQIYNTFEFETPEEKTNCTAILASFERKFISTKNTTYERHKFFTRNKYPHESYDEYCTELRRLAASCEFRELTDDDLITDKLIMEIEETHIKDRLLREPNLILARAIELCTIAKTKDVQAEILNPNENNPEGVEDINVIDKYRRGNFDNSSNSGYEQRPNENENHEPQSPQTTRPVNEGPGKRMTSSVDRLDEVYEQQNYSHRPSGEPSDTRWTPQPSVDNVLTKIQAAIPNQMMQVSNNETIEDHEVHSGSLNHETVYHRSKSQATGQTSKPDHLVQSINLKVKEFVLCWNTDAKETPIASANCDSFEVTLPSKQIKDRKSLAKGCNQKDQQAREGNKDSVKDITPRVKGQQQIYKTQATQHMQMPMPPMYITKRPQAFVPPDAPLVYQGQPIPSQFTFQPNPNQTPTVPFPFYSIMQSHPSQSTTVPPNANKPLQTMPISQPQPQFQRQQNKRRVKAIPVIDPDTGVDRLDIVYELQNNSHPPSGESCARQTP